MNISKKNPVSIYMIGTKYSSLEKKATFFSYRDLLMHLKTHNKYWEIPITFNKYKYLSVHDHKTVYGYSPILATKWLRYIIKDSKDHVFKRIELEKDIEQLQPPKGNKNEIKNKYVNSRWPHSPRGLYRVDPIEGPFPGNKAGGHYYRCVHTYPERRDWYKLKFEETENNILIKCRGRRTARTIPNDYWDINFSRSPKHNWKQHTKRKFQYKSEH